MAIFRLSWEYLRATVSYIAELSTCLVSRCDKAQIKQNRKQITNLKQTRMNGKTKNKKLFVLPV
jgi:hypothetical protein